METIRDSFTLRSVDLRNALGISPSTFMELTRKFGISPEPDTVGRGIVKPISPVDVRRVFESRGFKYPSPACVISFMICKGGVGKTTSTYFTAQRLSSYGAKVLVIDADSQGNLTSAFNLEQYGVEMDEETPVLLDVLTGSTSIDEAIIAVTPNLHLVPSTPLNAMLDGKIRDNFKNPSLPIKKAITPLLDRYDYILFDCAPALNLTNTAVVCASNKVILPVSPDKFSQLGLEQTLSELSTIEADFGLQIDKKIIFTKYDGREFTSLKYLTDIADKYNDIRFNTAIRTSADVKNAITKKEDLFTYKKSSAKEDYDAFVQELMGLNKIIKKTTKSAEI
jgi:chromosome partitioning protein